MGTTKLTFYQTTIGKKVVMAISGLILIGFVIGHMLGNLQIMQELMEPGKGKAALNAYAAWLHSMPGLIWGTRAVLLVAVLAHAWSAISLIQQNSAARPVKYARQVRQASTAASKSMKFGGITILFFIVYHLLHLTCGVVGPEHTALSEGGVDVYMNVVNSFQIPYIAGFYVVAQAFLALHLFHGTWSLMQTLGLNHDRYNGLRRKVSTAVALAIGVGNISIPVAVLAGLIK